MTKIYDVAVIGGGASGLFFAANTTAKDVCIIEAERKLAKKLAVTGGGKCNFSNAKVTPEDYVSSNAHFCRSALAAFQTKDFLKFLEENMLAWEEREQGRLFLKAEAAALVSELESAARKHAQIINGTEVLEVKKEGDIFILKTRNIDLEIAEIQARNVVVASGGLALYGTDAGLKIAESFGIKTVPVRPALCAVEINDTTLADLAGISVDVKITFGKKIFTDGLVFTHNGLGGPAVYQTTLYAGKGDTFEVDFLPKINIEEEFARFKATNTHPSAVLANFMPKRLAAFFAPPTMQPLSNITKKDLETLIKSVKKAQYKIANLEGYKRAEVMRGGVDTKDISSKTMESTVPGLYFIGETLDVTGRLGGYNLHWCWASALAAAKAIK